MKDFAKFSVSEPSFEALTTEYDALLADMDLVVNDPAADPESVPPLLERWDELRRMVDTWANLTEIRFDQDTTNPSFRAALDRRDEISPKITELDAKVQRRLVESCHRAALEEKFGPQAFAIWEMRIRSFDPVIEADLVQESKLTSRYNELLASAKLSFQGEEHNLSGILQFTEDPDRQVRHDALEAMWGWFAENAPALDQIYDDLVKLRHGMALKLGCSGFTELAYRRMARIDYDAADVATYREEVRTHIVPVCRAIRKAQAESLGLEKLMFWDENLFDSAGNPRPQGTYDEQIDAAQKMFNEMNETLGGFFQMMRDKNLMDLQNRPGKAGGGFCTSLADQRVPFIFANFNGTMGDVEVFTHEMGHAYQCYASFAQTLLDYVWPTYESCEIHSMGLEYMCWPHMEKFFGEDAGRFRRIHLIGNLLFLPYGVAVDHFQHLVYERPQATPAERHAMWQEVEKLYLADTDYGDLPHLPTGGRWQQKRHIYMSPFYYIDYTLAQCCAMQFWLKAEVDPKSTLKEYLALCARGGSLPFQELVTSAGLTSPFKPGCLKEVAAQAKEFLGI